MRSAILAVLGLAAGLAGQVVGEVRWGYAGKVVPERFNLLSIRIDNPGSAAFSGELRLWRTEELLPTRLGAEVREPCFVAAGGSRWVTLYPFVTGIRSRWSVRVGDVIEVLDPPEPGPPATVYLGTGESVSALSPDLPIFDAERFPPTVLGTAGLGAVVLDRVPEWDGARRQAFLRWVYQGGVVHLLENAGRHPSFAADLAPLNADSPHHAYGDGLVVRHAVTIGGLDPRTVAAPEVPVPFSDPGSTRDVLELLHRSVRPKHDWSLIMLIALLYLGVIGPGYFLVTRRVRAVTSLALFVVAVAGFTQVFHLLGRRGYGEQSLTHTLSHARAVAPDRLAVRHFTDVFVTGGDRYELTRDGEYHVFATAQQFESVPGVIRNGVDGTFAVDIPLFSHRGIVHETTVKGSPPRLRLDRWPESLGDLVLYVDSLPEPKAGVTGCVIFRGVAHELTAFGPRLVVSTPREVIEPWTAEERRFIDVRPDGGLAPGDLLRIAIPEPVPFDDDAIHVLLILAAPREFALQGTSGGEERAFVLHHLRFCREDHR